MVEILSLIFLSVLFTQVIFHSYDPRGLIIVAVLLIAGEVFTQMKWRASMVCKNCGFDPVLYVRDQEAAGQKVKAFLEKRPESAEHLLKPAVKLPVVRVPASKNRLGHDESAHSKSLNAKLSATSQNLSLKV